MAEPGKDTRYRVVLGVGVGALVLDQLTKLWVMGVTALLWGGDGHPRLL